MADDDLRISGSLDGDLADALAKLDRRIDSVEESLGDMAAQATATGRAVEDGTDKATEGLKRTEKAAKDTADELGDVEAAAERNARQMQQMTETNRRVARSLGLVDKSAGEAEDALDDTARSARDAARALDEAGDEAAEAGTQAAASTTGWGRLARMLRRNERVARIYDRTMRIIESTNTRGTRVLDRFRESWQRFERLDWNGMSKKVNDLSNKFGRFRYALMAIKFTALISAIFTLLGLLSSLAAGAVAATGGLLGMTKGLVAFLPVAVTAMLAMKAFSLAAEALAPELDSIKKRFEGLGEAVARGDLRQGLRNLNTDMEEFAGVTERGFERIGAALGRGASRLGQYLALQSTLTKVDRIFAGMQPILDNLVDSVLNLAAAFVNVLDAAMPVGRRLSSDLEQLTFKFRAWTEQASASGEMTAGIDRGYTQLVRTATTLSNFIVGLATVFRIGGMHAGWMGDGIQGMSERFKEWTQSFAGQISISAYFRDAMPAVKETLLLLRDLIVSFAELATQADLAPLIAKIRTELLPVFSDLTGKIALDLGPKLIDLAIALGTLFGNIDTTAVQAVVDVLIWLTDGLVWVIQNVPGATFVVSALVTALLLLGPAFAVIGWGATVIGQAIKVITFFRSAILAVRIVLAMLALQAPGFWAAITGPIGIAVVVVAALVGAFIWAYNNVEWFRNGVNAALSTVGGFFVWLWDKAVEAFGAISAFISQQWTGWIKPTLDAIWFGLRILGAIIFTVLVAPFVIAWNLLTALFTWAYGAIIAPVLGWIGQRFAELGVWWTNTYNTHIAPVFQWFSDALNWLNVNIVQPVLGWISAKWAEMGLGMKIMNDTVINPTLQWIGDKLNWLNMNVVQPVLGWISAKWTQMGLDMQIIKQTVIDPVFSAIGAGLDSLGQWFQGTVDNIGRIWGGLKTKLAVPINFVIDKVWNNGILAVWNWVADKLGLPTGTPIAPIPEFRKGGPIRGAGTGTSDSIVARVSNNEHVWTAEETDAVGGHRGMLNLRRMAREGRLRMAAYATGGPVTPQEMHSTVRGVLPATRLTSAFRPGDPGFHGRNRAADLAGPRSMDTAYMRQINSFIGTKFPGSSELIFTPGPYNLKNGRSHTYPTGVRADHHDHVHWANNGSAAGEGGGGVVGAFWDTIAKPALDAIINPIINAIPYGAPPEFLKIPKAMATWAKDGVYGWAEGRLNALTDIGGMIGGAVENVNQATAKAQVRAVAIPRGWGFGAQWNALERLVQGESGWRVDAANPTSSARGLFQKMTSLHGPVENTAAGQAMWGLNYIGSKYGNPVNAYAKWSARKPHWYDDGGYLEPGLNLVANGTGHPEPVFTEPQWGTLSGLLDSTANLVEPVTYEAIESDHDELLGAVRELAHAVANQKPPTAVYGDDVQRAVTAAWRQARREDAASGRYSYAER